jgi:hypothetical protein
MDRFEQELYRAAANRQSIQTDKMQKIAPRRVPQFQNRQTHTKNNAQYRQKLAKYGRAGIDNKDSTVL